MERYTETYLPYLVPFAVACVAAAIVVLIVQLFVRPRQRESYDSEETIFVSIPAYRDKACTATVVDMFAKAKHPERVFAGMCVQTTGDDTESCLPKDFKYHANVRIIRIPHLEAKGPCYARSLCASLWRGETWFLGIDSHSRWAPGWDERCLDMVHRLPPKSILSHYPPAWDEGKNVFTHPDDIVHVCKVKYDEQDAPALEATRVPADGEFRRTPYVTGGFTFAPGKIAKLFDPTLDHLWVPEEFLLSARLYTHGYDVYTPTQNVVSHFYERKGESRWFDDIPSWSDKQTATLARVLKMLDPDNPAKFRFGMGGARTLRSYYQFAGVDFRNKRMVSDEFCK